jgi:hypothetical protein
MGTTDTVKQEAVRLQNTKAELPPIANPMQPPDVRSFGVYHQRGNYFIPRSKGGWYPGNLEAAKDYIVKNYGIRRDKVRTGDSLTQINDVMVSVRDLNSVVWAGSCGGMPPQLISVNGTDILILDGPKLIAPMKGDFQIINYILLNLLGVEQLEYFNGWMKWGHENLLKVYGGKEGRLGVSKTATLVQVNASPTKQIRSLRKPESPVFDKFRAGIGLGKKPFAARPGRKFHVWKCAVYGSHGAFCPQGSRGVVHPLLQHGLYQAVDLKRTSF